jgi:hypothetical protein
VIQTVACLVSGGELTWFLMCTLLVTETMAYIVSDGGLAWVFIVLFCGDIYFGASFLGGEPTLLLVMNYSCHTSSFLFLVCKLLVFHCIFF